MMKVVRLYGLRDVRLTNEPDPQSLAGEELIDVRAIGICGSDLNWFSQDAIASGSNNSPRILGHEFAGVTKNGLRVAIEPAIPCRECDLCLNGNPNLCEKVKFAGYGLIDGALQEKIAWDSRALYPIPDSFTFADGAMLEPLGVAIHAVDLAKLKIGMKVGIIGCGPIGLLIMQLVRLAGAGQVICTDKLPHRVDAAIALGATNTFLANEGLEVAKIFTASGNHGFDIVFEVAGEQDAVETAFESVAVGGKVILVGIPGDDRTSFPASVARRKGLTIKMVRRMKHTYPRAIELVEKKLVDVNSLVTHRYPLEKAAEAFEAAQQRVGIKVMIEL